MKTVFWFVVLAALVVGGMYVAGVIHFSSDGDQATVTVETKEIREGAEKAVEKGKEAAREAEERIEEALDEEDKPGSNDTQE